MSAPGDPARAGPPAGRRHPIHLAVVAGVVALTIGLSGFFMGMRQTMRQSEQSRDAWEVANPDPIGPAPAATPASEERRAAPQVVSYAELKRGALRANAGWVNNLAALAPPPAPTASYAFLSADEQELVRRQRASRRHYDGAPPVAPHPLDQLSPATCLECHGKPTLISGVMVPRMSHQPHQNCLQCHVSGAGPTSMWRSRPVSLADGNRFLGKAAPGHGARAFPGAPPSVPHTTWMRQNCITCHGPGGTTAFRTSHPERHNCLQCHPTDARAEQRPTLVRINPGAGPGAGDNAIRPPRPGP